MIEKNDKFHISVANEMFKEASDFIDVNPDLSFLIHKIEGKTPLIIAGKSFHASRLLEMLCSCLGDILKNRTFKKRRDSGSS